MRFEQQTLLQGLKDLYGPHVKVSDDAWLKVVQIAEFLPVKKNEVLQKEGEPTRYLYHLANGIIREHLTRSDGSNVNITFRIAPAGMGALSAYRANQNSEYSITMVTDGHVFRTPCKELVELLDQNRELERWMSYILSHNFMAMQRRLLSTLQQSAEERMLDLLTTSPELLRWVPSYHLASYLGITPVTYSRIKQKLLRSHRLPDWEAETFREHGPIGLGARDD